MIAAIAGLFSSAAAGGLTGLIGGVANKFFDWLTLKERQKHELAMRDKDLEIARTEADRDVVLAKEKSFTEREVAETAALGKSFEADKAAYFSSEMIQGLPPWAKGIVAVGFGLVDFIRGLTRPGITLYMCVLTTLIYLEMQAIVSQAGAQAFTPGEAVKIIIILVDAVVYLTSMCIGWWFGARAKTPQRG